MRIHGYFPSWETEGSILFSPHPLHQGLLFRWVSEVLPSGIERDGVRDRNAALLSSQKALWWPPLGHMGRLSTCNRLPISSSKWQEKRRLC